MLRAGLIVPLIGAVLVSGCGDSTGITWPPLPPNLSLVPHQVIDEAHTLVSAISEPRRDVIRDAAAWARFWDEFQGNVIPTSPPPAVDFTQRMVLVAATGTRPTGGYAISIEGVYAGNGVVVARALERAPHTDCIVTTALTAPATAVSVPRVEGEVRFHDASEIVRCS